ncbi:hypothetical protein C8R43DRAFT_1142845 [Mycena crocata]|nr:hypothetical protein C8R43DRAFT_1142845 [Mycena crocata]
MSKEEERDTPPPEGLLVAASTNLTYHTITAAKPGSKAKPKDVKEVKTKEIKHLFETTRESYIKLLNVILAKHGEDKYKASENIRFGIRVLAPPDKLYINHYDDYEELVAKLLDRQARKITIWLDMADIQKAWSTRGSAGGNGEDGAHGDDASQDSVGGLSALDLELARIRGALERKYQNDHDGGYTYVGRNESYPLTPFMILEWTRAIYDGEATKYDPPNAGSFDPANRQKALHAGRAHLNTAPTAMSSPAPFFASRGSDLGHLATIITTLSSMGRSAGPPMTPVPSYTPSTSASGAHGALPALVFSPPMPTPSKLRRFLQHAEDQLGVKNALDYESALEDEGYGPDILHLVDSGELVKIGLRAGDIIRLKAGAEKWWTGPDAKRKRADSQPDGSGGLSTPDNKKVSFEYRSPSGGGSRFFGPRMTPGDVSERDRNTFYRCEARNDWFPLPLGYVPVQAREEGEEDDPFQWNESKIGLKVPLHTPLIQFTCC